jgi:hypothetical protein
LVLVRKISLEDVISKYAKKDEIDGLDKNILKKSRLFKKKKTLKTTLDVKVMPF